MATKKENITAVHTIEELREMAMAEAKASAASIAREAVEEISIDGRCCVSSDDCFFESGEHLGGTIKYSLDCEIVGRDNLVAHVDGWMELTDMVYIIDETDYCEEYYFTEEELAELGALMDKTFGKSLAVLEDW